MPGSRAGKRGRAGDEEGRERDTRTAPRPLANFLLSNALLPRGRGCRAQGAQPPFVLPAFALGSVNLRAPLIVCA